MQNFLSVVCEIIKKFFKISCCKISYQPYKPPYSSRAWPPGADPDDSCSSYGFPVAAW
jgi:hypothetical protein